MRKYSLYTVVFIIFGILIIVNSTSVYFSISQHKKDLIETAIKEKIHLAETLNKTLASPSWIYRLALVPGMEKALIEEMADFKDVKYIRVVNQDGTIYKSSIEKEWGEAIKEPDLLRVINAHKTLIKDSFFNGERVKLIIYPGYQNKTVWIAFTLADIEKTIRRMWIRDFLITGGGLLTIILVLFVLLREIVDPLKKITTAFKKAGKGNLSIKVKVRSKTEIGELANAFNETIGDLKELKEELEEANRVLEIRVRARTRELREQAEVLKRENEGKTKTLRRRLKELERFQRLTVGRELKMIELKKEIERLKKEIEKYKSGQSEAGKGRKQTT